MFSYKLNWNEYALLCLIVILDYIYVRIDQLFVPEKFRAWAFALLLIISMLIFFFIVKPPQPFQLSRFLSLRLGLIVMFIILIQHVLITLDITFKALILLLITISIPWLSGLLYKICAKIPKE